MSDELLRLADRVEAATGPSRELDASIAWAIGRFDRFKIGMGDDMAVALQGVNDAGMADVHVISPSGGRISYSDNPPHYSASLDAAMTLVPESWRIGDISQHDHEILRAKGDWTAWVYPDGKLEPATGDKPRCRFAASAPLALTAASLRARASHLRMEVE